MLSYPRHVRNKYTVPHSGSFDVGFLKLQVTSLCFHFPSTLREIYLQCFTTFEVTLCKVNKLWTLANESYFSSILFLSKYKINRGLVWFLFPLSPIQTTAKYGCCLDIWAGPLLMMCLRGSQVQAEMRRHCTTESLDWRGVFAKERFYRRNQMFKWSTPYKTS